MKKIATTITTLMLTVLCVHAQEDVPAEVQAESEEKAKQGEEFDISKAFPEEEIAHKMEMKGMKVYNYTMSHKFADLDGKLEKFLGEEWEKSDDQEQAMEAAQKQVEAQGMKILGMVTYEHSEKTGNMVMLMQMTTPVAGGEAEGLTMVTLTHINM
ncbi:hypothetical protein N9496_03940 [Akkermansiaceae bacterium]|nr:hypothetical protein [Akkermansiaceae bacterium]